MISIGSRGAAWAPKSIATHNSSHCSALQLLESEPCKSPGPPAAAACLTCSSTKTSRLQPNPSTPRRNDSSPPPLEQHPAFRQRKNRPRHVPIIITQGIIESVLRSLPQSPKSPDGSILSSFTVLGGDSLRSASLFTKPKHIPIIIPHYAQPFGLFPPTPSSSECSTRRPSVPATTGLDTPPMSMSRPTTGNSQSSTWDSDVSANSPEQRYTERFPKASSSADLADMNGSQTSLSHEPPPEQAEPSAAPRSPEPTSSNAMPPTAGAERPSTMSNLSGLVCNVHRCTGEEPHALVGATTTVLGDKLYVFGGRRLSRKRPALTADLYELDLIRRHWTKLETYGAVPSPRYFHSVCSLGDGKLVCYGGMSPANPGQPSSSSGDQPPEVVVMSDIHIYDTETRTWTYIPTADTPQGRYAHCATILPSSAIFTSANAPLSAIHHNPSSGNPNQGTIGVTLDGAGGAEMVVVGGQDSANHYIEQISVFNLRSLKWTATNSLGRSCGAYRSVVAPLTTMPAAKVGVRKEKKGDGEEGRGSKEGANDQASMLIYSNYNFLDVKLELQVRLPDGSLTERAMHGQNSPPGLRFPNGGVLDQHFVVSGTYLTSSRQEYALWALDLRNLTWSSIDAGGSVFSQGSWNRGVLWPRRNAFVILGSRKRNLVEDYNHRRINFTNICMVELEAFGLYDNPRRTAPTSSYVSASAPLLPPSIRPRASPWAAGGRPHSAAADELGQMAMSLRELADMDIMSITGERIPVNSHLLARRWGPYFVHLLKEGSSTNPTSSASGETLSDGATLRPQTAGAASRNSSITITPSIGTTYSGGTLHSGASALSSNGHAPASSTEPGHSPNPFHPPNPTNMPPPSRARTLFLPHTPLTIHALLHYLYTSSLPPPNHHLSTPLVFCSLLQLARPYHIDGLLEAVVERLHTLLDDRSAAAVFNASAMAAGGGRGTGFDRLGGVMLEEDGQDDRVVPSPQRMRVVGNGSRRQRSRRTAHDRVDESTDEGESSVDEGGSDSTGASGFLDGDGGEEVWAAGRSCVVGLQKRGLRGLMEGRRLRERGRSVGGGEGGG